MFGYRDPSVIIQFPLFPGEQLTVVQLAIAGGFSGFLTTTVMAPGERIKCILQVQQVLML
jgi:hypothetical protein